MYLGNVKSALLVFLFFLCFSCLILFGSSCKTGREAESVEESALTDSLLSIIDQVTTAVNDQRYPDFLELVDPDERGELEKMVTRYGYSSVKAYLDQQMHGWPNTDTLTLADLVWDSTHARLTFEGNGASFGLRPTIRYTIMMLRHTSDGWRLTAMTSIEKEAEDRYGNRLTYHETELPSKLRFPRPLWP